MRRGVGFGAGRGRLPSVRRMADYVGVRVVRDDWERYRRLGWGVYIRGCGFEAEGVHIWWGVGLQERLSICCVLVKWRGG